MDIASICPFPAANTGHAPPALRPGVRICPPAGEPRPLTNSPPTPHPRTPGPRVHRYRPGACPACGSSDGHSANMPTPWREDWPCPPVSANTRYAPGRRAQTAYYRPTNPTPVHTWSARPLIPDRACPACGSSNGHSANMPVPWRKHWTCPPAHQASDRTCLGPPPEHAQPGSPRMDIVPISPFPGAKTGHVPRGCGEVSAFMLFFIDKATDSKIKSIKSTGCDGNH